MTFNLRLRHQTHMLAQLAYCCCADAQQGQPRAGGSQAPPAPPGAAARAHKPQLRPAPAPFLPQLSVRSEETVILTLFQPYLG